MKYTFDLSWLKNTNQKLWLKILGGPKLFLGEGLHLLNF